MGYLNIYGRSKKKITPYTSSIFIISVSITILSPPYTGTITAVASPPSPTSDRHHRAATIAVVSPSPFPYSPLIQNIKLISIFTVMEVLMSLQGSQMETDNSTTSYMIQKPEITDSSQIYCVDVQTMKGIIYSCNIMCCYADKLKEGFFPWIDQVMEVLMSLQGSQMETDNSTTSYMIQSAQLKLDVIITSVDSDNENDESDDERLVLA
nr:importin beta-3, putative [Tanacetum cinerariifolium]